MTDFGPIDAASDRILPDLGPNERVLWDGEPYKGFFALRGLDLFLIPFSIMWGSFAFFWNVGVWSGWPTLSPFALFGLPFLAFGMYFTVGRFVHNWFKRSRIRYVLTNERAVILSSGFHRTQRDWLIGSTSNIEVRSGRRRGTVIFDRPGSGSMFSSKGVGQWGELSSAGLDGFQFYRITDAELVASLVRDSNRPRSLQHSADPNSLHSRPPHQESRNQRRINDGRPSPPPWDSA